MTSPRVASSSARADVRAPLVAGLAFVVAKLAAGLVNGAGFVTVLAFGTGFLGDAIVVALVAVVARLVPRIALALAGVLGLYACANVYLVAAFGSPLTAGMLAYRKDADTSVLAGGPLAIALASIAVFALGAALIVWKAPAVRPRTIWYAIVPLAILGVLGRFIDTDGGMRALGLDRNAVALLVTTALPERASDARIPWDAPWPAPRDAKFTAAVDVERAKKPKHVVIWLAESTGAKHTSVFGGPKDATPTLEKLRAHELRFASYDANAPVSAKAIFTTMCGFYPSPEAEFETRTNPRIACPSLMETLTAAGWDAALFHGGYFAFTDKLQFLEERGFETLMDGESVPDRDRYWTNGWGVDDAAIVAHGVDWIDAHQEKPTLEVFIPLLPHYEYFMPPSAPKPFGDATLLQRYQNGVHYSDELFGRLVEAYRERGILDDTLFVFVGDHGEAFEEHPRNKLHAGFLYEENVHAPLVLYSTALFPHEEVSERLASHVDLAATILDLVGVAKPPAMQGRSLVGTEAYRPTLLFTSYPDPLVGLRDGDRKYIRNLQTHVDELYDLARDPQEKRNVAAAFPDVVREYRARLADFTVRQKAFVDEYPHKDAGFLDRVFADLSASVDGVDCVKRGDRVTCSDPDVWLAVEPERVFNMDRRCLRVSPPTSGKLVVRVRTNPPVKTFGIGLTDKARFSRGSPVHAKLGDVELVVDDKFETTSKVSAVPATSDATIEIWRDGSKREDRSACLLLAP
jgi:arylsulfatase A-like enzyme